MVGCVGRRRRRCWCRDAGVLVEPLPDTVESISSVMVVGADQLVEVCAVGEWPLGR